MPNFDFKCSLCEKIREIYLKPDDDQFPKCDDCNITLQKVYSAPGIILKGSGWGGQ